MLINDPIHGPIELNSLEKEIIDTPELFRLKDIKQLGTYTIIASYIIHVRIIIIM